MQMQPTNKRLIEYFQDAVKEYGNKRYLFDEVSEYSYGEAYNEAIAVANELYGFGIKECSLVALRTTRSIDSEIILTALQFLGATVALFDPHSDIEESVKQNAFNPQYTISNEESSRDIAANGGWIVKCDSGQIYGLEVSRTPRKENLAFPAQTDVKSPAVIIFTSGSTGRSKGVVLTQYSYMNHVRHFCNEVIYDKDDIAIMVLPLNHVFGFSVVYTWFYSGCEIFFPKSTNPDYVADCIEKYKITRLDGVPSYALLMCEKKQKNSLGLKSLRSSLMGGAPLSPEQFGYIEKTLGIDIEPVYGMTECIAITAAGKRASFEKRASGVGNFLAMCEGKILADGEICVKAPSVMWGYWNDAKTTAEVVDADGFLHTGDLGYLDNDGYLHVSGRKKDIIICNGTNISAIEVENKILGLKGIKDVAVFGLPDRIRGEIPVAAIVYRQGANISYEELQDMLCTVLNNLEIPKKIMILPELPLTSSGKKDKQTLKKKFE